jgi:cysteine synthase
MKTIESSSGNCGVTIKCAAALCIGLGLVALAKGETYSIAPSDVPTVKGAELGDDARYPNQEYAATSAVISRPPGHSRR